MNVLVFISYCIQDKETVSELSRALKSQGLNVRADSRVIRDGDPLPPQTREAIEKAHAFILAISPDALDSEWVQHETQYALKIQRERRNNYHILPLLLKGADLGALKWMFPEETVSIPIQSQPKSITEALPKILDALRNGMPGGE